MPRTAKAPVSTDAKNHPVIKTGAIDAAEQPLGHTVRKNAKPTARTARERVGEVSMVQVAERMPDPEKLAMEAFMNEQIDVQIAHTTDKNALPFELTINGRTELFRYGEQKTVRRCYVDLMARLKVTSIDTPEKVNPETGERYTDRVPHTALKYPFVVVRDPNPQGRDWLKATLAMPG